MTKGERKRDALYGELSFFVFLGFIITKKTERKYKLLLSAHLLMYIHIAHDMFEKEHQQAPA